MIKRVSVIFLTNAALNWENTVVRFSSSQFLERKKKKLLKDIKKKKKDHSGKVPTIIYILTCIC